MNKRPYTIVVLLFATNSFLLINSENMSLQSTPLEDEQEARKESAESGIS